MDIVGASFSVNFSACESEEVGGIDSTTAYQGTPTGNIDTITVRHDCFLYALVDRVSMIV